MCGHQRLTRRVVSRQPSIVGAGWYLLIRRNCNALLRQVMPGEGIHRCYVVHAPIHCYCQADLEVSGSELAS